MRLIKLIGIAVGLWFIATIALIVWVNTTSDEEREQAIEAAAEAVAAPLDAAFQAMVGPPPEAVPPDDVLLAETAKLLAEVEALYDELIGIREAIEAAHVDEWEKRWARDSVTLARMDKRRAVEAVNQQRDRAEDSLGLALTRGSAEWHRAFVEQEVADAREKLRIVRREPD